MAGTSGPLGTSGSDMVGGPGRNWGCLAGEGRTGEGRRREAGAGAGFSCCCRCRTPELSLQTLGLGQQAGPGVRPPKMSGCRSPGPLGPAARGAQAALRDGPVRFGGRTSPRKASPWKVCAPEREGTPASLVEPRRGLGSPKCLGADAGGAAHPLVLQVEPLRWSRRAGLSSRLPRGTNGSLRRSAPFGSVSPSPSFSPCTLR